MVPRVKADKTEVLARLQQMRDTGLDSIQMAAAFQAEGWPTLSGKGSGMLARYVNCCDHPSVTAHNEVILRHRTSLASEKVCAPMPCPVVLLGVVEESHRVADE